MKLPDISTKIKRLASLDMPVEALKVLFLDLAVELDLEEARLSKDRARKPHGISKESPRNLHGNGVEFPASRVIDNLPTYKQEEREKGNLTVSQKARPSKPLEPPGFSYFFAIYPKRAGGADRKTAAKAYGAALKRTNHQNILDAANEYANHCNATGKTGTEFVLKARKWLNDNGWENTYETARTNHKHNTIAGGFDIIDRAIAEGLAAEERLGSGEGDTERLPGLLKIAS